MLCNTVGRDTLAGKNLGEFKCIWQNKIWFNSVVYIMLHEATQDNPLEHGYDDHCANLCMLQHAQVT